MGRELIKNLVRESLNNLSNEELTIVNFKNRIPFLKNTAHEVELPDRMQIFTEPIILNNIRHFIPNKGIINIEKLKAGAKFEYVKGKISGSENIEHIFKLVPYLRVKISDDDKLFSKVFQMATNQRLDGLKTNEIIETPNNGTISKQELDMIINKINKSFFEFEEFVSNLNIELD